MSCSTVLDVSRVLPELDDYAETINPRIIGKAREIYATMTNKNRRGKSRKRYIFYCIYHAYLDLGYMVDQDEVARKLGLERNQISLSKSLVPDRGTTYTPSKIVLRTVKECLATYYDEFFMERSSYNDLVTIANNILIKAPHLNNYQPHIPAALIACIFAESKGCEVDKKILAETLNTRWTLIIKLYSSIQEIYFS